MARPRPIRARTAARATVLAAVAAVLFQPGWEEPARADITGLVLNPANGHFYKRVAMSSTWAQAKTEAENQGGYLVTLTSLAELNWVIANLGTGGGDTWIGGTDSAQEGNWQWVSGEPWSWSNWNSGEPNNSGGEHWIEMYTTGLWNDVPLSHANPGFVIEWDEDPNTPPPPVAPAAPTNLSATITFQSSIALQWVDNSDNESAFEIERKTDTTPFTRISRPAKNTTTYEDSSLAPLTTYTYRVRAVNSVGPSNWTNEDTETSGTNVPITPAPADLAITSQGSTTADIEWTDMSNGEIGFEVWRQTGSAAAVYRATTAANATTYHDTGLVPDTDYTWQVRSVGTVNPSGFVVVAGTSAATLQVTPVKGDLKDSPKFGKDSLKFTATWDFLAGAIKDGADPVVDGFSVRAGLPADPLTLKIPANFDGWKGKKTKFKWKSTGSAAKIKLTVDTAKRSVVLSATGLEWDEEADNPVRVSLGVGNDAGTSLGTWTVKKAGFLQLR